MMMRTTVSKMAMSMVTGTEVVTVIVPAMYSRGKYVGADCNCRDGRVQWSHGGGAVEMTVVTMIVRDAIVMLAMPGMVVAMSVVKIMVQVTLVTVM